MIGAIAGDIIGSVYERNPVKTSDFPLFRRCSVFTDDTVLTVAIAFSILRDVDYATSLKKFGRKYPNAGYGGFFRKWLLSDETEPYGSWGNGSAMRVSPVGFAYDSIDKVLEEAKKSAEVTHNHLEGIKGAQAAALSIFLARKGKNKAEIKREIGERFTYDLDRTVDGMRPDYQFDPSCQGSVPEAIISFLESDDFEDAVRKGISLGGDSDTIACISGAVAHAFYGEISENIVSEVRARMPEEILAIADEFILKYGLEKNKLGD